MNHAIAEDPTPGEEKKGTDVPSDDGGATSEELARQLDELNREIDEHLARGPR